MKKNAVGISVLIILSLFIVSTALAQGYVTVGVNQSLILNISSVERVAVANPAVADVIVVSGSEIMIVGKTPGVTTMHVWSAAGRTSYAIEVGTNDIKIANDIKNILGYQQIKVSKINNTIILEGQVNDQYQKARAAKVASAYGDKVVNLLEITKPVQVKIEAKIVEISKEKSNNLGIKWGNSVSSPGVFTFGQSTYNSIAAADALGKLGTYSNINGQLDALIHEGAAKLLSQPNMITLSGEKANILVGGEIPVPVSIQNGQITIEWKEYGIKLEINPEVNAEGLINSKVKAEVSTLDFSSAAKIDLGNGLIIPPLKTRRAETVIALASGQTMAIGGLISSEVSKSVDKLPLLADIPVLGKLFQSKSFSRGETEVVILVTPTIVDPETYSPPMSAQMQQSVKNSASVKK